MKRSMIKMFMTDKLKFQADYKFGRVMFFDDNRKMNFWQFLLCGLFAVVYITS